MWFKEVWTHFESWMSKREIEICKRSRAVELSWIELCFNDLDPEHKIHKNMLDKRSRTNTSTLWVSAENPRKEGEILMIFKSLHGCRLITKMLEHLSLAWSSLGLLERWRSLSVCSWCSWWKWERFERECKSCVCCVCDGGREWGGERGISGWSPWLNVHHTPQIS